MSKHTSGTWAVSKRNPRRVTANGTIICNAVLRNQGPSQSLRYVKERAEAEANARLIAAAPDLLVALRNLLDDTQHRDHDCGDGPCPVRDARAAIAKATGDQP
jgi:hypothetical protein